MDAAGTFAHPLGRRFTLGDHGQSVSFIRRKIVNGREYLFEVESYRNKDGAVRQRTLRYLGATDPVYGRPPVDYDAEVAELERRRRTRVDSDS